MWYCILYLNICLYNTTSGNGQAIQAIQSMIGIDDQLWCRSHFLFCQESCGDEETK